MRINYVLIDYENVQPTSMTLLDQEFVRVIVFLGANQTRLPRETVLALQRMGDRAEYVEIEGQGNNALDFHIAFYIGALAATDPTGYFHIISKDTGFDPLLEHLKGRKILARRWPDVESIPVVKMASAATLEERLALFIASLERPKATRPRSLTTLANVIRALFQNQIADAEVSALIAELQRRDLITITDLKVAYKLSA